MAKSRTRPQRLGYKEMVRQEFIFRRKIQKIAETIKAHKAEIVDITPNENAEGSANETN